MKWKPCCWFSVLLVSLYVIGSKAAKDLRLYMFTKKDISCRSLSLLPEELLPVRWSFSLTKMIYVKINPCVYLSIASTRHKARHLGSLFRDLHVYHKKNWLGDTLEFHLAFCFFIYLYFRRMDCDDIWCKHSCSTVMNCTNFHPLTFHLAPSSGRRFNLANTLVYGQCGSVLNWRSLFWPAGGDISGCSLIV